MTNKYSDYDDVELYNIFQDMDKVPPSDYREAQREIINRWETIVERECDV